MGKKTWWWAFPAVAIVIAAAFFETTGFPYYYIPRVIPLLAGAWLLPWAIRKKHLIMFGFSFMLTGWLISDAFKLLKPGPEILAFQKTFDIWINPISYSIMAVGLLYLFAKNYIHLSFGSLQKPVAVSASSVPNVNSAASSNVVDFPVTHLNQGKMPLLTKEEIEGVVDEQLEELEKVMRAAVIAADIHNKILLDLNDLMVLLNASPLEVEAFLAANDIPKIDIAEGTWAVFKEAVFLKIGLIEE